MRIKWLTSIPSDKNNQKCYNFSYLVIGFECLLLTVRGSVDWWSVRRNLGLPKTKILSKPSLHRTKKTVNRIFQDTWLSKFVWVSIMIGGGGRGRVFWSSKFVLKLSPQIPVWWIESYTSILLEGVNWVLVEFMIFNLHWIKNPMNRIKKQMQKVLGERHEAEDALFFLCFSG